MPCHLWPLLAAVRLASAQPAPDAPLAAPVVGESSEPEPAESAEPEPAESVMIDRAVAVVGVRVITRSELEMSRWLEGKDPSPVPAIRYDGARPTEWWIEQVMLRELAGDISVYQPDPAAVRERAERLLQAIDPDELSTRGVALGADRGSIVAWVHGRMVVERFVVRNLGPEVDPSLLPEGEQGPSYAAWLDDMRDLIAIRRIPLANPADLR